jgi:hypothetical protein
MSKLIPNLNTFADLIDRLAVEIHKLAYFENAKREEHAKEHPDPVLITKWDNLSRDCCEFRSQLKNKINETLTDIVASGKYETLKEARTFRAPKGDVGDLICDMFMNNANAILRGELAEKIKETLNELHSDKQN